MKAKSTKGQKTRHRILEAASTLIQKSGVNGTSVDDVLKASKTGKSQFYHYFGSKSLMIRDLIEHRKAGLNSLGEAQLKQLDSPEAIGLWLDAIIREFEQGVLSQGCPIGDLAAELACSNEELRSHLNHTFNSWSDCLETGFKEMAARGDLDPSMEPAHLASFFISAIEGAILLAKTARNSEPLKATAAQLMVHLSGGRKLPGMMFGRGRPKTRRRIGFCP